MTTQALKYSSIFALFLTAACTATTVDEQDGPHLGVTTNQTAPVDTADDAIVPTVQQNKLPILTKEPLVWEPVESAAGAERIVQVRGRKPSPDPTSPRP